MISPFSVAPVVSLFLCGKDSSFGFMSGGGGVIVKQFVVRSAGEVVVDYCGVDLLHVLFDGVCACAVWYCVNVLGVVGVLKDCLFHVLWSCRL